MIKFFRKIRQKLLSENKYNKYLIYAIGEILIIVIGVLIAVQINNRNETNKNELQTIIYLEDLKTDVEYDIKTLNEYISSNYLRISNVDTIIKILTTKDKLSQKETLEFINLHLALTTESYFIPEKSTIKQIESSSHGDLIQNKELRNLTFRYYSTNERNEYNNEVSLQLYQHSDITKNIFQNVLLSGDYGKYLFDSSFNRPQIDIPHLWLRTDYLYALFLKKQMTDDQNMRYKNVKTMSENLVKIIEKELIKYED